MTPEEIKQTASFLLNKIEEKASSANEIINRYTESHRYIVGDDRRDLLELVWQALRNYAKLTYLYPNNSWEERLEHLPDLQITDDMPDWVKWEAPEWIVSHIPEADKELPAQNGTAPICLRAYGNRDKVLEELRAEGLPVRPADQSPFGIILEKHANLSATKVYKKGLVEVQDEGAQLVSMAIGVKPKDDVFDFSDIEDLGKPTMNDIRDGKATLPIIKSLQRATKEEANQIKELAEALANKSPHIDTFEAEQEIRSFVLRYDGTRYAHQLMEKYRKKATDVLRVFPDNKYKECLLSLLNYAINRMH